MVNNIYDLTETDYGGLEGKAKAWDTEWVVLLDDESDLDYANACVAALENLSEGLKDQLLQFSYDYWVDFSETVGEDDVPLPDFTDPREIRQHISPSTLVIESENKALGNILHLGFDCEWEEEHGMEWLIQNGEILYVGADDDVHAGEGDKDYYEKMYCNYAFGNKW